MVDTQCDKLREDQKILLYDVRISTSSHFIMNKYFKISNRRIAVNVNSGTSFLIQQLVTSHENPEVSLLYPESMLFPSFFCKNSHYKSNLGCISHYFYQLGHYTSHNGIASVENYNYVRMRDGILATSTSDQFIHFAFDVKMNCKLNNISSEIVFKRGFEHLIQKGITGYQQAESTIEYDEFDSNKKVNELSSLMREKP